MSADLIFGIDLWLSSLCHRASKVSNYDMLLHIDCKILTTLLNGGLTSESCMFTIRLRWLLMLYKSCENMPVGLSNIAMVNHMT